MRCLKVPLLMDHGPDEIRESYTGSRSDPQGTHVTKYITGRRLETGSSLGGVHGDARTLP